MELLLLLIFLLVGFVFGQLAEKRHYRRIVSEEERLKHILVFGARRPDSSIEIENADLVTGSVVISVDYFKRFVAGLRTIIGGRLRGYETLLDRARREAILRMKENARHKRASMIFNTKIETSSISKGRGRSVGTVEVFAYGTAIREVQQPKGS